MKLIIEGTPIPKQSARFYSRGGKVFSYQTQKIKQNASNIALQVKNQLPPNFRIWDGAIEVKQLHFIFPCLKSFPKRKIKAIQEGEKFYKETKPDLSDNLPKSLFDSLQGILYANDSQIVKMNDIEKYYGLEGKIILEIEAI